MFSDQKKFQKHTEHALMSEYTKLCIIIFI